MHLFIEESFLIKFENGYNIENPSIGRNCIHKILTEYTRVRIYFDKLNVFQQLDSKYLRIFLGNNPTLNEIGDFDSFFDSVDNLPNQTIVLCIESTKIKEKIQRLGGLCFDYETFETSIKSIIDNLHFKFSFADTEQRFSWSYLSNSNLIPIKTIVIDDPYILKNQTGGLMKENLIPLLKNLLKDQKVKPSLTIFSNVIQKQQEKGLSEVETVKSRYSILESELKSYLTSICIAKSKIDQSIFEQHDRYLYTPFTITSVGIGFNIFPIVGKKNSKIEQLTIFDKFSYNEMKNHFEGLKEKYDKLANNNYHETLLKIYPSSDKLKLYMD